MVGRSWYLLHSVFFHTTNSIRPHRAPQGIVRFGARPSNDTFTNNRFGVQETKSVHIQAVIRTF